MKVRRKNNDYLAHHGVKGQQWGVRNGPPYPIEDKVLKKGTKLNTVVGLNPANASMINYNTDNFLKRKSQSNSWVYTYNKDNEWDNKVYKGPFSYYIAMNRGARYVAEHQLETVKDLKMPTKKERIDEFKEVVNDNKRAAVKELEQCRKLLVKYQVGNADERKAYSDFNSKKFNDDIDTAYSIFNHMMENNQAYTITKKYTESISKKFDAMVDDNNQGVYNRAQDPIIVFKAENLVNAVKDQPYANLLTVDDIKKNKEEVGKELEKYGEHVKL